MKRKGLREIESGDLKGRTVFVRVDFNVPLDPAGGVADDTRLRRTLPTLRYLSDAGARSVLLSHLGRPGGAPDPELSLEPVAPSLEELVERPVAFVPAVAGEEVARAVAELKEGGFLLLENTRFDPGETGNDAELADSWAEGAELFVNDAFGTAHRAHASTVGLARAVRERGREAVMGFLLEEELRVVDEGLGEPERPFVAVLGGAKISGKIDVIRSLLSRVDRLAVGGAMANTFLQALGLEVGASLVEEDRTDLARSLLEEAGETILLPVDCVVASRIESGVETRVAARDDVGRGDRIGDVGPGTRELFLDAIRDAETVVWNGPMGVFEVEAFAEGTRAVARGIAEAARGGALTVAGGGDSAAAVEDAGVAGELSHVSTGGGAFLELLSGAELPGVVALSPASRVEGEGVGTQRKESR